MIRLAGILNITPDSFYDGGRRTTPEQAIAAGVELHKDGARWVDVGGESTRPGADPVSVEEELRRVMPVIEGLVAAAVPVSVDTRRVEVAAAALGAGAEMVNDVSGLEDPAMAALIAEHGASVVIMHMRGEPATMQDNTRYDDLMDEIRHFLAERIARARTAGVVRIWADPGIGFGKSAAQCVELLRRLPELAPLGVPLYVGASRKSFIGRLADREDPGRRLGGSIAAALAAAEAGASVIRVHDVAATRDALMVWHAIRGRSR